MIRSIGLSIIYGLLTCSFVYGQGYCQTYRIVERTVYEQQPVTTYRLETEWITEEQEVTTYEDVWVTEYESVTTYKPVFETEERYETRIVRKPVWETQTETTYEDVIEYETVTEEREEVVMVPKTIRETKYREEQRVQRVPVTQTYTQQEAVTTLKPVTSYRTELVDQGGFVDQLTYQPGNVSTRLQWMPPSWNYDPMTGANYYQRRGFQWVPMQAPGSYSVQRAYVPNVVAQQVPVTSYVPETVIQQRPVQITQYQDQVSTYRVPYEEVRTEYERQVVRKPVTYQRPVTKRIEHKKPVQVLKYIEQEIKVPVKSQTVSYKPIVEQKPIQVLKRVPQVKKVTVQKPRQQWVKRESVQSVPRTVTMRVPIDAYGNPIYTAPPTTTISPAITSERPEASGEGAGADGQGSGSGEAADSQPSLSKEQADEAARKAAEGGDDISLKPADGGSTE